MKNSQLGFPSEVAMPTHLIKFLVSDHVVPVVSCVFPVSDSIVDLLRAGAKELFFDQLDVEALAPLEGIKPLAPDPALVWQQGHFAVLLALPLVVF